jgi:hypothetical protein
MRHGEKLDAATLLGSIFEKRPGAAGFLVAEGALPAVTQLLISGAWSCVSCCVMLLLCHR